MKKIGWPTSYFFLLSLDLLLHVESIVVSVGGWRFHNKSLRIYFKHPISHIPSSSLSLSQYNNKIIVINGRLDNRLSEPVQTWTTTSRVKKTPMEINWHILLWTNHETLPDKHPLEERDRKENIDNEASTKTNDDDHESMICT